MSASVFTGWRTVVPGECRECGSDDDVPLRAVRWQWDGRGTIYCGCQTCPDCGCWDGHYPECAELRDEETEL